MTDVVLVEVITGGPPGPPGPQGPPGSTQKSETPLPDAATITPLLAFDLNTVAALSQPTLIAAPSGTPNTVHQLILRITTTVPRAITFAAVYRPGLEAPLPTMTSGGGLTDYLGFIRYAPGSFYDLIAYAPGY